MSNNSNNKSEMQLNRDLGLFVAFSIGIGTMIGAGVFVLPGIAATLAGPSVLVSFLLCGLLAGIIALCMSELATAMPHAGGGYLYVVRAFGPLVGMMIGWALWLSLVFASAFYMIGFGHYLGDCLRRITTHFSDGELNPFLALVTSRLFLAVFFTMLLIGINYLGAKGAGWVQKIIVGFLILILLLFVIYGLGSVSVDRAHFRPFFAQGVNGVFLTSSLLFITFMGFAEIAAVSEEIKRPERNLPLAMLGSVLVVTVIYLLVVFVLLGLVPFSDPRMNSETVIIDTARIVRGNTGYVVMLIGGILATLSSANASIMAASRINFAMGRDKLVSNWVNKIHPRFKTPYRSIVISGGITLLCLFVFGNHLVLVAQVASFLGLVLYALVTIACVVMRSSNLEWYKPAFKVPLFPWLPLVGFFGCLFIISQMQPIVLIIGIAILAVSLGYFIKFQKGKTELVGVTREVIKERFIGSLVDRYAEERREKHYVVIVPAASETTGKSLMRLGAMFAEHNKGEVRAVHVIPIPRQTSLEAGRSFLEHEQDQVRIAKDLAEWAKQWKVKTASNTIVSHAVSSAILSCLDSEHANLLIMGWRSKKKKTKESIISEVTKYAGCDVVVLRDRGLDNIRKILVLTRGGAHSDLGLKFASILALQWKADITVMTVQKGKADPGKIDKALKEDLDMFRSLAQENLQEQIVSKNIEAEAKIVTSSSAVKTISKESKNYDLLIVGASNEWRLKDFFFGSIPDKILEKAHCSVIMVKASAEEE